jgi:NAD(P)-dependent dehydrogenase (short-subunit alcohol dehydrogenase family)
VSAARVALVTGAAGGIGGAIAQRLARAGFRVACADIDPESAARAAAEIAGAQGFACDLRSEDDVAALRDAVTSELGTPWLLVNAAGVFFEHEITELSVDHWDLVMNVNARGTFLACRALLGAMAEAGSGCIVNIASTAGLSGGHTRAAYNASKGAVVMFTRSLAIDWGPRGVRVNCVCPGLIDTPMADWIRHDEIRLAAFERSVPAGRIGTPQDVAEAVAFLASDSASYMHGSTLVVDGGVTA